jgi:methionyl-tRNA synthetase
VEVEEERLLVCTVSEVLGVLEELGVCPYCEGKGLPGGDSCPVCGRTAEPTGTE